jgi:hypothetical protein
MLMKNKYLALFFALFLSATASAQLSRLIGLTKTRYDGTAFAIIGDSTYNIYSGVKDTTHNGSLAFDSSYTLTYLPGYTTGNLSYRYYQSFTGTYNSDTLLTQTYDTTSTSWINNQLQTGAWNTSNNITQHIVANWDPVAVAWLNNTKTDYTYVGLNNTLKILQAWNTITSAWVNREKDSFAYDASNNMIYHLAQHWDTTGLVWVNTTQFLDTYNVANQIIASMRQNWSATTAAWRNNSLTAYHYNAIPMLCNTIVQHWDTSALAWANFSMDSITYTPGNDIAHEATLRWDTSLVWIPQMMNEYSYDASHNMITDTVLNWVTSGPGGSHFANSKLKQYTYNTYNQVLTYTTESWTNPGGPWYYKFSGGGVDQQYRYYYEYVDTVDHTGVTNVSRTEGMLTVSPNPSNTILNIKINWQEAEPFTMSIYDMSGAVVRQWMEQPVKNYSKVLSLNDLPVGNYIIKARAQHGMQAGEFTIVK